ncbi:NrfD/PsrC family molybdoenzyme membrane anchor subunit [Pelosinus sp. sgz500959]|uniref:NrfD/PsrC family molybdoenzyme membrane anchor subunit n=1 Tax=Pelosinus sp. sgz500959 TaxID=3242472 RepID=UPI0036734A2F
MVWGTLVAIYLFLAGIAGGAYLTATCIETFWNNRGLEIIRRYGLMLCVPLVAISSVFLVLDAEAGLHNPLRLFYVVANFPHSMMSVGTLIITSFQVITLLAGWKAWKNKPQPGWLRVIGSLFAIALTVYTGLLLGVSKAIPFWNSPILPLLFTVSGMSTGCAAAVLLGIYIEKTQVEKLESIKKVHLGLLMMEVILIFVLLNTAGKIELAGAQSVAKLMNGSLAPMFWLGLMGLGLGLPIAIEIYELVYTNKMAASMALASSGSGCASTEGQYSGIRMLVAAETFVLTGGFILRYLILAAGVYVKLL